MKPTIIARHYPSGNYAAFAEWPGRTICGGPYPTEAAAREALQLILETLGEL